MASETVKNIQVKFNIDLKQFEKNMKTVSVQLSKLSKTFKSTADDIKNEGKNIEENSGLEELGKQADATSAALEDFSGTLGEMGDEFKDVSGLTQTTGNSFEDLNQSIQQSEEGLEEMQQSIDESGTALLGLSEQSEQLEDALNQTTKELKDLGGQSQQTNEQIKPLGSKHGLDTLIQKINQASEATKKMGQSIQDAGQKLTSVGKTITATVTAPILGVGTVSSKVAIDFESAMLQVAATMGITSQEIANGSEDFEKLEQAAKDMGASTQFSASEAAQALNYLALAGYDANKSVEVLPKVLNLAAAGGLDLAYASDLVTDSMAALGLETEDTDGFIDQLAKTSQKSNTSVAQLGEAILTVGGTAKTLAGGTTELNTALGILADNGIKGSEGGTALRNVILSLSSPTDKARKTFDKLGVSAFDANGNMRPINETLSDLNEALDGMSDSARGDILSDLFEKNDLKSVEALMSNMVDRTFDLGGALKELGIDVDNNKDKIRDLADGFTEATDKPEFLAKAMTEMGLTAEQATGMFDALQQTLSPTGSRFDELTGYIAESEDAAKDMADTMNSGVKGRLSEMSSALEGVGITIGERLMPYISDFANKIIELCGKFQNLSPEAQDAIVKFGAIAAVIGPLLIALGGLVVFVGKVVTVFGSLIAIAGKVLAFGKTIASAFAVIGGVIAKIGTIVAGLAGSITLPMVLIGAAIAGVVAAFVWMWKNWDKVAEWLANSWEWVKTKWTEMCQNLSQWGQNLAADMKDTWEKIKTNAIETWTKVCDFFINIWTTIKAKCQEFWTAIANFFINTFTTIKNKWEEIWKSISDFFKNTWNSLISFASTTFENFKSSICNVASAIRDGVVGAFNGLKNGVLAVWEGLKNGIKSKINGILKFVNSMIRALSRVKFSVPDWVPGIGGNQVSFSIPEVPLLATGGQVNFGTAIVGEAGPELLQQTNHGTKVTPLSTHEKAGGISEALGAGLTVQIDRFINNTDRDIEELSHRLADHFSRNMRGRGLSYE